MSLPNHRAAQLLVAALLASGTACAHRGPAAAASGTVPEVLWPQAPGRARVRLKAIVNVAVPAAASASWWRGVLAFITGSEERAAQSAPFLRPFGVAFTTAGGLIVADPDAPSVARYTPSGEFEAELTCKDLPWVAPMGLSVGADGGIFVADGGRGAVVRWSPDGCLALGAGELSRPTGVALYGERVFVADPPSHRVVVYSTRGPRVGSYGTRGSDPGQFNFPTDLAVGPDGTLWVVDALNFRVAHLSPDGRWLGAFGEPGESDGGLARPKGIHVDAGSRIYVSDAQRDVVLVFGPDGTLDYVMGAPGTEPGRFTHPAGIDVEGGRLVVADSQNRRVQIFEILGERT